MRRGGERTHARLSRAQAWAIPQLPWGLCGGDVATPCPHPATCDLLGLSWVRRRWRRSDPMGPTESHHRRKWTLKTSAQFQLVTDATGMILSGRRALTDFCPHRPMKYWSLFLLGYLLLHSHRLYSVSPAPVCWFYNCVFLLLFSMFDTISFLDGDLFCISVFGVVWIGPALCFEVMNSVSPPPVVFEPSSSPQFWSDGVCVFIKVLFLLNVQSVAFVQGRSLSQCNVKC